MTYDEMLTKIREILPKARFEEDNNGQILIYTDMEVGSSENPDEVVPYDPYGGVN